MERDGICCADYILSKKHTKGGDFYAYSRKTRRVMHIPTPKIIDNTFGTEVTFYDLMFQQPWDSDHIIIGEDTLQGRECFVVESKITIYSKRYIKKMVTWIEKENFLDFHIEQFDKNDKIFKVFDKKWIQLEKTKWWAASEWNVLNLKTGARAYIQFLDWIINHGYDAKNWGPIKMLDENVWRRAKNIPKPFKKLSEFPLPPEIRWEYWEKAGVKPASYNSN